MFKNLFKGRNKNKKKISGMTEIVNYDITIQNNARQEMLYESLSQEKINLLESLDSTINNLNSKRIIKEKQLRHIETKVNHSQKILDKHNEFIKRLETKLECTICNDREKDTAIVPCGHTFCSHCIKDAKYCFICRAFIIQPLKIYFN